MPAKPGESDAARIARENDEHPDSAIRVARENIANGIPRSTLDPRYEEWCVENAKRKAAAARA